MFALNWVESLLAVLWLVGVICAVAAFVRARRGLGGMILIAAAVVVPVVGSLLAIGVVAMDSRSDGVTQWRLTHHTSSWHDGNTTVPGGAPRHLRCSGRTSMPGGAGGVLSPSL